jgi:hypothetical protein
LQSAQDPRLAEVLKSFETFLEDMFNRKEGHDFSTLIWVAETYRALGDGLEKGDPAKAESYFGKGAAALQLLLDMEAAKPATIPEGAILGVQLKLVTCKRRQKSFAEAHQMIVGILKKKARALDVQEEAARLFQDWASRGDDLDKWEVAIKGAGAEKGKTKDDKNVWGWVGLAEKVRGAMESNPTPEYEKQYLDASFNAADCWHKYAVAQSTDNKRKKLMASAYTSIRGTAAMMPSLGGGESWARFNSLYRVIEQDMLDLGMPEMKGKEVVDLEKRGMTKEERAAAKKAAQENAAADGGADLADEKAVKKKKKSKAAAGDKQVAKAGSGGSGMMIAVVVVVLAIGGGAAYFFLVLKKKAKPRRRPVVIEEPDLVLDLPQSQPTKSSPAQSPPPKEKTVKTKRV